MRIAQQLYEGIDIKGSGTVGVITYLRTDSTRISAEADANAREYIAQNYGENYVSAVAKRQMTGRKFRMHMKQYARQILQEHQQL